MTTVSHGSSRFKQPRQKEWFFRSSRPGIGGLHVLVPFSQLSEPFLVTFADLIARLLHGRLLICAKDVLTFEPHLYMEASTRLQRWSKIRLLLERFHEGQSGALGKCIASHLKKGRGRKSMQPCCQSMQM